MKVVITEHHYDDIGAALRVLVAGGVEVAIGNCHTEAEAVALARDADGLLCQHLMITETLIQRLPRCRVIAHFGKGVDNIDVDAATRQGIFVTNVRDANWDEVSNHVLALVLAWARNLVAFDKHVRAGGWSYRGAIPRHRLSGQVLGIVGFGDIARILASKARALGLSVVAYARQPEPHPHVRFVDLPELLRISDYVSVNVPLTPETAKLIGERELGQMKSNAFLINTSRGGVIDQTALVTALRSRQIAGAGLDVVDPEPPPLDDPLLALENVILTPHVAWYSEESREDVTVSAARDVLRVLQGGRPLAAVNPGVVPRFASAQAARA